MTILYYILQNFAIIISLDKLNILGGKMNDFFKRNLVWITILLCVAGVVLSIIGIPIGNPIFFFIGIILSLPTVGYLIYQVFFDNGKVELNLNPTSIRTNRSNVTSIITNKNDVLLRDQINNEDDLESLYHGYANEHEIAKRLHELTNEERERTLVELPEIIIPEADPHDEIETTDFNNTSNFVNEVKKIENTTNDELHRQREIATQTNNSFNPEIPITLNDKEDIITSNELSLTDPNFVLGERVMPETSIKASKSKIIKLNPQNAEKRKQKAEEKKALLSQENLERYLKRYFVETATCFLMDRTIYKDTHGIAPYNKFTENDETGLPEYVMSCTKGRLYKFCTYLIDAERFITHEDLYTDFIMAVERGISLARISETLHPMYRKKHKKDFILNLSNREDWDNVIILVYNNYMLNNDNFKDVFTRVPFEIPLAFNEPNIVDYLKDPDIHERFNEKYTALAEIGIPTFWDALYICFINSIKQKLTVKQLEDAILRNYRKVTRALKRADHNRKKLLRVS